MTFQTASNDLYAGISPEIRAELAQYEKNVTIPQGTRLLETGVLPDYLVILNSGTAETFVSVQEQQVSLGVTGPGRVFGLLAIFSGDAPETTVTCLEDCQVTLLPREAFRLVLGRHPEMHSALVKVLSMDLATADHLLCQNARVTTVKPGRKKRTMPGPHAH